MTTQDSHLAALARGLSAAALMCIAAAAFAGNDPTAPPPGLDGASDGSVVGQPHQRPGRVTRGHNDSIRTHARHC